MKNPLKFWVLATAVVWLSAHPVPGRTIDLSRIDPVPATEQIPIQDFFRPRVLQQPSINLAGTQIAALITAGDDRYQLLVYDLKTMKIDSIGGMGDKDIFRFTWLGDDRLIFTLSEKKIYGVGVFAAEADDLSHAYPVLQFYGTQIVGVPKKNECFPLIWNRYDFETHKDRGVVAVNTNIKTAHFVNLSRAGSDWSDLMDVRDMNEKAIEKQYPLPEFMTYGYAGDKDGELELAFTSDNGALLLQRLKIDLPEQPPPRITTEAFR